MTARNSASIPTSIRKTSENEVSGDETPAGVGNLSTKTASKTSLTFRQSSSDESTSSYSGNHHNINIQHHPNRPFRTNSSSFSPNDYSISESPSKSKKDGVHVSAVQLDNETDSEVESEVEELERELEAIEDSVYPEVRAAVNPTDDVNLPVNTWRTWVLTTIFVIVFAAVNQFFSLRYPALSISFIVAQLILFPLGKLLNLLPNWKIGYGRFSFYLNSSPFNVKEHAAITIAVSLTSSTAYATNILSAQTSFYKQNLSWGYKILIVLTSQMLGYGFAGLTRRWIVYPAAMIWPQTLVSTVLFRTLHGNSGNDIGVLKNNRISANGWTISRYRFFAYVMIGSFVFYWFPGFIFKGLSYFTVLCWIWPKNRVVNQLFGYNSGLGILPLTFDWQQVVYNSNPLASPWWVICNTFGSVVLIFWIVVPILYYKGVWFSNYLPMLSSSTFDHTGVSYNSSRVLNSDYSFNHTKYESYSPLYMPMSYSMSTALNFAAVTAIFTHCALYNGKDIWQRLWKESGKDECIHRKLMRNYKEAPQWWYATLFIVVFGLTIFTVRYYDTQCPVWALIVALLIFIVNFIPQGVLEGITNQHVGLNIITELIGGYILPGKPLANLMIKLYGFIPMRQGLEFSRDLKLAQYMKIPPRILFFVQLFATILGGITQVAVQEWMNYHIPGICTTSQSNGFTCPNGRSIYNASLIWGAIGPAKMFSKGKPYYPLIFFFLIGAVAPFITWGLRKRFPKSWIGKLNAPVLFTGPGNIPPATGINYSSWAIVGFIFNYVIRKRAIHWWRKYNYVLAAAMDSGVAVAGVVIFLCVSYPGGKITWWGNTVYTKTYDWKSVPYRSLGPNETFGYTNW
ncbi:Glutathione transporter Pgt1 [Schizosaccharomyces pombe]|uniref:Glutathione transporter 1 n=1 Tax=Schizosaccharomyces pombe (strain 972 / ATCC 24843) TaxID=284812 RepID=PGT1_SCHPO|nr:glutathione transporter Pgt1 [Schizosaccharomyces pombe]O14031.1 RecName: Full=Glutathione transporter 1 [Schizosaccharomyces pombe 972h-]CAB16254.1 glutathione transporter Pgt1 [Schizosaccharomyces pombe]|eukprot:NP_594987.1 glutathione transporter Pgt1 [Schizosaccharomyces pombe]